MGKGRGNRRQLSVLFSDDDTRTTINNNNNRAVMTSSTTAAEATAKRSGSNTSFVFLFVFFLSPLLFLFSFFLRRRGLFVKRSVWFGERCRAAGPAGQCGVCTGMQMYSRGVGESTGYTHGYNKKNRQHFHVAGGGYRRTCCCCNRGLSVSASAAAAAAAAAAARCVLWCLWWCGGVCSLAWCIFQTTSSSLFSSSC